MPTMIKKYLKDKQGNYLAPFTTADMVEHADGETTEVKLQTLENQVGDTVLTTTAQNVTDAINELNTEIVGAKTDVTPTTYNSLGERLDAMDVKIAAASGGQAPDVTKAYVDQQDDDIKTTIGTLGDLATDEQTSIVLSINELHDEAITCEDYTGTTTTVADLSTRVTDLEVDNTSIVQELEDSHTDSNGVVHGTIGQRLDNIEGGYLPLTGGIVTGDVHVTQTLNGTNIGTLKVSSPPGEALIITSNVKTYFESPVNHNGNAIENVSLYGLPNNFISDMTDGIYMCNTTNNADFTIRPNTDKTSFTTTGNVFNFNGVINAQDAQIRTSGWGKDFIISTGTDHCYIHNTLAGSYLTFRDNGCLQYSGDFAPGSDNNGNLGIASNRWSVLWCANGTIQTSDMRHKSDIRDIDDNIFYNMIKNSGVHSYVLNYKDMPENITQETAPIEQVHVGIIAQEVAQNEGWEYVLNTTTNEDGDIEYSVNNYNLTSAVMAALKVEITKREELEQENQELRAEIEAIKAHVGL